MDLIEGGSTWKQRELHTKMLHCKLIKNSGSGTKAKAKEKR